jgi:hypothetical protein
LAILDSFGIRAMSSTMASRRRAPLSPDTVKDQIAVRYCPGQDRKVREALDHLGKVEEHPSSQIFILHRSPDVSASKLATAIETLKKASQIAFATPVLRDPESGTRQVLTDEITLRLKPGNASRALKALKAEHGVIVGKRNEFEPTQYIVKVPDTTGTRTLDVARSLDERDDVEFAYPNYLTGIKR